MDRDTAANLITEVLKSYGSTDAENVAIAILEGAIGYSDHIADLPPDQDGSRDLLTALRQRIEAHQKLSIPEEKGE